MMAISSYCCVPRVSRVKAFRAFQEAVKCSYDSWKIWENLLVVSDLPFPASISDQYSVCPGEC